MSATERVWFLVGGVMNFAGEMRALNATARLCMRASDKTNEALDWIELLRWTWEDGP